MNNKAKGVFLFLNNRYTAFQGWVDKKNHRLVLSGIMSLVLFFIFVFRLNLTDRVDVQYGSDEWDYQAIAVNFATGHGFHIAGHYGNPEVYKFGQVEPGTFEKQELLKGIPNIHRPPLYPLAIGLVYKMVGVHPNAIVVLQLILLCLATFLMPLFGYKLLKTNGFIAGFISAVIFIWGNYTMAQTFLPGQSFTVFFICAYVYVTELFFKEKKPVQSSLSAFILGLSLLFHATMILVVGFIGIYLFFGLFRQKNKYKIYNLLVYVFVLVMVLLPWHLYAYKTLHILKKEAAVTLSLALDSTLTVQEKIIKANHEAPLYGSRLLPQRLFSEKEYLILKDSLIPATKDKGAFFSAIDDANIDFYRVALLQEILDAPPYFLIFLSITKNMAMDCHNEYIILGQPIQTWRTDPASYYNNDGRNLRISFVRVFNFYRDNPGLILPLMLHKINTSLGYSVFLRMFFLLSIFLFTADYFRLNKMKITSVVVLCAIIAVSVFVSSRFLTFPLLLIYSLITVSEARSSKSKTRIPLSFNYIFFTLVIFSVIAMGNQRYFEVLNLFFVFFSFLSLFRVGEIVLKK